MSPTSETCCEVFPEHGGDVGNQKRVCVPTHFADHGGDVGNEKTVCVPTHMIYIDPAQSGVKLSELTF